MALSFGNYVFSRIVASLGIWYWQFLHGKEQFSFPCLFQSLDSIGISNETAEQATFLLSNGLNPYSSNEEGFLPSTPMASILHFILGRSIALFGMLASLKAEWHLTTQANGDKISPDTLQSLGGIVELLLVMMLIQVDEINLNHAISFAFLLQLDYFLLLLGIPLVWLVEKHRRIKFILEFCLASLGILLLNWVVFGRKALIHHFIRWANVNDVTPNLGIQWYLFQECLPEYENLFKWAFFKAIPVACCAFVCHKLGKFEKQLTILVCFGICISFYNPYPSLGSYLVFLKLACKEKSKLAKYEKLTILIPMVMFVCWLLSVAFWHNWIHIGSLNVNYSFYALLVFHISFIISLTQMIRATRKDALERKQESKPSSTVS